MIENINACSFDEAYEIFLSDHKEYNKDKFISISHVDLNKEGSAYEGLGFVFYRMVKTPGVNVNQTQTKVIDFPSKGTKKWESKYLVVDRFNQILIYGTDFKFKKEAVDAAREYTCRHYLSSYILLGKTVKGVSKVQSQIDYKPAPSQDDGVWEFIY